MSIHKKKLITNLAIFIFFLTIAFYFVMPFYSQHYCTDDYVIMDKGYYEYGNLALGNGRPLEAIMFFIISNFSIQYYIVYRISLSIAIVLCAICMYVFFKKMYNINQNKGSTILLLITTLVIFLNSKTVENMLFVESSTMWFASLMSILASFTYVSDKQNKNVITLLLLILAVFSYQATLNFFVPLTLILILTKNNFKINLKLKDILKVILIYIIPFIICYIYVKVLHTYGFNIDSRISQNINYLNNIMYFTFNVLRSILFFTILTFPVLLYYYIVLLKNKKENNISINIFLNIITILLFSIFACTIVIIGNTSYIADRMMFSVGAIPGIIGIIIYLNKDIKINYKPFIIIFLILFILQYVDYSILENKNLESTKLNRSTILQIKDIIDQYETTTGKEITMISFYCDDDLNYNFWSGSEMNAFNYPAYYMEWSKIPVMNYYLDKKLIEMKNDNNVYETYFKDKNWDEFSEDQLVLIDNTLHICKF